MSGQSKSDDPNIVKDRYFLYLYMYLFSNCYI